MCEETASALGVPAASIHLFDKNSDALCYAMSIGLPPDYAHQARPIPRALCEEHLRRMGPVTALPDVCACSHLPGIELCAKLNIGMMSARMLREDQLVG